MSSRAGPRTARRRAARCRPCRRTPGRRLLPCRAAAAAERSTSRGRRSTTGRAGTCRACAPGPCDVQAGEPDVYEDLSQPSRADLRLRGRHHGRGGAPARSRMNQYAWSNLVLLLQRGDFDVIEFGLEATDERRERIRCRPGTSSPRPWPCARSASARLRSRGKRVGMLNQTYAYDILPSRTLRRQGPTRGTPGAETTSACRTDAVLLYNIIAIAYGCTPQHLVLDRLLYHVARGNYVVGLRKADTEPSRRSTRCSRRMAPTASERIGEDQLWGRGRPRTCALGGRRQRGARLRSAKRGDGAAAGSAGGGGVRLDRRLWWRKPPGRAGHARAVGARVSPAVPVGTVLAVARVLDGVCRSPARCVHRAVPRHAGAAPASVTMAG